MFSLAIYHNFQTEIWRLRFINARAFVNTINIDENIISEILAHIKLIRKKNNTQN